MTTRACGNCKHWEGREDSRNVRTGELERGECRRSAPRPFDRWGDGTNVAVWPITAATDWCGQFEQKLRATISNIKRDKAS